jgi:hypothetical protein
MTMKRTLLILLVVVAGCGPSVTPESALNAEIDRLIAILDPVKTHAYNWQQMQSELKSRLEAIRVDAEAGRTYYALHDLSRVRNSMLGFVFTEELGHEQGVSLEEFDREWHRIDAELAAEQVAVADGLPAAVRAMAQAAETRVVPYHQASFGYARGAVAQSALFFLGRARAHVDFVRFCNGLDFGESGSFPERSYIGEVEALEKRLLDRYTPPLSLERHADFIAVSAGLKVARDLDGAGSHAGALYEYLRSVMRLGQIELEQPAGAESARYEQALAEAAGSLSTEGRDDSIALLFIQQAQSELAAALAASTEDESTETVDVEVATRQALLSAEAVLERVLPAYAAAIESESAPPPASAAQVTVTVVRWPYT